MICLKILQQVHLILSFQNETHLQALSSNSNQELLLYQLSAHLRLTMSIQISFNFQWRVPIKSIRLSQLDRNQLSTAKTLIQLMLIDTWTEMDKVRSLFMHLMISSRKILASSMKDLKKILSSSFGSLTNRKINNLDILNFVMPLLPKIEDISKIQHKEYPETYN